MNDMMGKKLMDMLLNKYERSNSFRTGTAPTKRILLKLYDNGKCEFPEYDIEKSEQRIRINDSVQSLARSGLVGFDWMKGENGHIVSRIWLNMGNLQLAYGYARRQPKRHFLFDVGVELANCMNHIHAQWMQAYLQDACEYIERKQKMYPLVPENAMERQSLLKALRYIDSNENGELLKRIFSIRCFGDSKHFEKVVERKLLRILRKYIDNDDGTTDEQLLNQIGIVKYPEQFEFCGPLSLRFPDCKRVDFASLHSGVVYEQDMVAAQLVLSKDVHRILSIENKANYVDYISKQRNSNELVIYHAGQYSPAKRTFLQAVAQAASMLPWYHWGDIDYGGFSMLARLRRDISHNVQPYRMNIQELIRYTQGTISFSPAYSSKLRELSARTELADCLECLRYMQANSIRLEQEVMLE
ncbi:MAG: DUF2220 family protein [Clostridia bacterium]